MRVALRYATGRDVFLPAGPLHRVAGFPLSLPCSVSGYEGTRTQEFEWFLYREDANGRQIGVVSTRDQGFPYTPFQGRVRSGEVRVERDSGDKARLVVQRLRPEDQGKYECYTPSTDSSYQGNYSATVAVKVMLDTLRISYTRVLTGQPVPEGAELTLTCAAGIQSQEHTHLSITFGKRGSGGDGSNGGAGGAGGEVSTLREIISLDRALGVTPGSSRAYKRRYDDGEITLEKRNGGGGGGGWTPRGLRLWILDPDGSWQKIAQRTLDIGNLTVQRLSESMSVTSIPSGRVSLQAGSPLSLTCQVSGLPSGGTSGLLVQWMKRGSLTGDASAAGGVEKLSEGSYALRLFSARPSDSGVYRCAVSVYAGRRSPTASVPATFTQRSEGVSVNLKTKEVLVSAVARVVRGPLLKRGGTVTLLCNVTVATTGPAQVQVRWLRRPIPEPGTIVKGDGTDLLLLPVEDEPPSPVAALTYEGLARIFTNGSEVSVDRVAAASYRLRVHAAEPEDQGLYVCEAERLIFYSSLW
ncbi:hypothetical protein CRUP_005538 [Coryphaenoides rupestris]|nr:hypothetical protein CRUP_005538 [Coryphaenoides rupestris]